MLAAAIIAAQAVCVPTEQVYTTLTERHGESRMVAAISGRGTVLEVWASPSGSWSALVTRPDGLSCMVDAGHGLTAFAPTPPGAPT